MSTPLTSTGPSCVRASDRRRQSLLPEPAVRAARLEDMIMFARRWGDFEGDEYILPEFGIGPATFYRRLHAALQDRAALASDPRAFGDLIDLCRRKIDAKRR